jgi:hemerythrin-like domain-containing protein
MTKAKEPGVMTREMVMIHTGFVREFCAMPELLRGVSEGDRKRAEIVADHIELIAQTLHLHHHGEDLEIWPRLLERCPEEIRPLVHGMEKHHELIAAGLDELAKEIPAWRSDASIASRDALLRTLDDLLPVLRQHLGMEVAYVLPLIEKHISSDEWDAMVRHGASQTSPEKLPVLLGLMMYQGDPRAVQTTFDNMPKEVRPILAEAAPKAYGDYAERVYGTRTPPHGPALLSSR